MKIIPIKKRPVDNQGWKRQYRKVEQAVQKEYVKWLRENYDVEVIFVANEGDVPVQYRKSLLAMGLNPGALDLIIIWKGKNILFQEMKSSKGKLRETQGDFIIRITKMGFSHIVSYGLESAKGAAKTFGFPLK